MTAKYTLKNKVLSIFLSLAVILTCLPISAFIAGAATNNQIADISTMDSWRNFFLPEGKISTENAGGVWTDKSVFADNSAFQSSGITKDRADSFLVALSAIGSNMTVTGTSKVPIDTMLVLDVSGSMNNNRDNNDVAEELVEAANESIATLLGANKYNRVGVVLYSGSSDHPNNNNAAIVLLELNRYKTAADGKYLTYTEDDWGDEYVSVNGNVRIDDGTVNGAALGNTSTKEVVGATYIQKGIIAAMNEMIDDSNAVTATDENGVTMSRKPVVVLMSDGAPTLADYDFTAPGQYEIGDGQSISDRGVFVTQLSNAYAKYQIEQKYKTDCLFYTLGLAVKNNSSAEAVLNPEDMNNSTILGYWQSYSAAAVNTSVKLGNNYYSPTVTKANAKLEQVYVDQYFEVTNEQGASLADGLKEAFGKIVGNIQLQAGYLPTLVSENSELSGYVSFVDKIGEYMHVVDMKGILMGNKLFSGAEMAKSFTDGSLGSADAPTELGNEVIWALQERLGITDIQDARDLFTDAYENGQIYYTDADDYSNYVGWYANADGEYLGSYAEGVTTIPAATGDAATDPVFTVKSYGYLGEVDEEHGVSKTDMTYVTVQVRKNIVTGEEIVAFAVPAALLPLISYNVTLDKDGNCTALTATEAEPIRLIYEVALEDEINEYTVNEIVSADYLSRHGTDGTVNFYTNKFEKDNTIGYDKSNTYSYFNPSRQNDRYYYTENIPVYEDTDGTLYKNETVKPTGEKYRKHISYEADGDKITTVIGYHPLTELALETSIKADDNSWYIPTGNIHMDYGSYDIYKGNNTEYIEKDNLTETLHWANKPFIDTEGHSINDAGYEYIVAATLGNNGKISIAPETGIKLSKAMAGGTADDTEFEFTIENLTDTSDNAIYSTYSVLPDGTKTAGSIRMQGGKATVKLTAGATLYIGGMTAGDKFKITEAELTEYKVQSVNGDINKTDIEITIADKTLASAAFVNAVRGKGNLTVAKDIKHELGSNYTIPDTLSFEIKIKLEGIGTKDATIAATQTGSDITSITTDENGEFKVTLKDDQQITLTGLYEGVTATVIEETPGAGFTASYWENGVSGDGRVTVEADKTAQVIVLNTYKPSKVYPVNIKVSGTKTLLDRPESFEGTFEFKLERLNSENKWDTVATEAVAYDKGATDTVKSFDFSDVLKNEEYTSVGSYTYQVTEVIQSLDGITYDRTIHSFSVNVTDLNMDGILEIKDVTTSRESTVDINKDGDTWSVTTAFTNSYKVNGPASVAVKINKKLNNPSNSDKASLAGFRFELYDESGTLVNTSPITNTAGNTNIVKSFEEDGVYEFTLKEFIPTEKADGYGYTTVVKSITVVVTDDGRGNLSAVVYEGNNSEGATDELTVDFTNDYNPKATSIEIDFVKKVLNGRPLRDGEFTFAVFANTDTEHKNALSTGVSQTDGTVVFDKELTFNKVGVYYYDILETSADNADKGIKTDKRVYRVTVTVEDIGGELEAVYAVTSVAGNIITFENTYTPAPTKATIGGTKLLDGRLLKSGEFTFVLTEALNADGDIAEGARTEEVTNHFNGSFTFAEKTYTKADTYYYTVTEKENTTTGGITYDKAEFIVTVTVTDDLDGKLHAAVSYKKENSKVDGISFKNTYKADKTDAVISGEKFLKDSTISDGQFSFELYETDDMYTVAEGAKPIQTVKNVANSFAFEKIDYTSADAHYYVVKEVNGGSTIGGIAYDNAIYRVRVDVVDNLEGKLVSKVNIFDENGITQTAIEFNNEYKVTDGTSVSLSGEKILTEGFGTDVDFSDFTFTFELYKANSEFKTDGEAVKTADADTNRNFSFKLDYPASDLGNTYYYVVKEKNNGNPGVTYSPEVYRITVELVDEVKDGVLEAKVTIKNNAEGNIQPDSLDYTNDYSIKTNAKLPISGKKNLTGRDLVAGEFKFELYKSDENGTLIGDPIETVWNNTERPFNFTDVAINSSGIHYFAVKENSDTAIQKPGVKYDGTVYLIRVGVADDGNGNLVCSTPVITKVGGAAAPDGIEFNNSYEVKQGTSVTVSGKKFLTKGAGTKVDFDDFTFSFEFYETDSTFTSVIGTKNVKDSDASGNFSFTKDYAPSELGKTYYYVVKEKNNGNLGITYSTEEYHITVKLVDEVKDAVLEKVVTIKNKANADAENDKLNFTNDYSIKKKAELPISGKKELKGRDLKADEFKFDLYKSDINGNAVDSPIESVFNDADESFSFKNITIDSEGTHYFLVKENSESGIAKPGVSYDDTKYLITVVVTDDKNGTLGIYSKKIEHIVDTVKTVVTEIIFENEYSAEISDPLNISGTKKLENKDIEDGMFAFLLYPTDENFEIAEGTTPKRALNEGETFEFDALTFTEKGTYYYVIVEDDTVEAERITFDDTEYYVTVKVEDDASRGKIVIKETKITNDSNADEDVDVEFTNIFTPKPDDIELDFDISKSVINKGSEKIGPEGFEFLLRTEGVEGGKTVKTDKDGKAEFNLKYTENDIGKTYIYTVSEVNTAKANVKYSTVKYTVKVTVSLNEDNVLVTDIKLDEKAVEKVEVKFENEYDYTPPTPPSPPESPKTGDSTNLALWFALLFISGGMMTSTVILKRKGKKSE